MAYTVVQNGDQVSIPVKVKNNSSGGIEPNAVATLAVTQGASIVSATPNKGTYNESTNEWVIGKMDPGDIFQLDVVVEVDNLVDAPYTLTANISGDSIETDAANNVQTYDIEAVSDLLSAVANNDHNVSFSYDLSKNDEKCNHCDTKWVIQGGTLTNLTVLAHDEETGQGELRLDDITQDGTFTYDLVCYGCGDGAETVIDSATVIFPKIVNSLPGGDVSVLTENGGPTNDDEEYLHSAGGVDTLFDVGSGRVTSSSLNTTTGVLSLTFKNGKTYDVDLSHFLTRGVIQSYSFPDPNTLRITQNNGSTDIDVSSLRPVKNTSATLQGVNSEILRILASDNSFVDADLSDIVVTDISIDETSAPTKTVIITFANGTQMTASFNDDTGGAGTGDNWGSQVVQSDSSLNGDGTSGNPLGVNFSGIQIHQFSDVPNKPNDGNDYELIENNGVLTWEIRKDGVVNSDSTLSGDSENTPLSVDPANNPMVSNFEIAGTNIRLTLTNGSTFNLTQGALQSLINTDTNTTELSSVGFNSSTNVLTITDDNQAWTVDLSSLITTSLAWGAITGKPTLSQTGGNVTGTIDLDAGTFSLNAQDTNSYVTSMTLSGNILTLTRNGGLSDLTADFSEYENKDEYYVLSSQFIGLTDNLGDASQLDEQYLVIPMNGEIVNFSFAFGSFDIGDSSNLRVHLYLNQHSSGAPISSVQDIDLGYGETLADHRVQLNFQNLPTVIAGDAVRFKITDGAGNDLTASTSTGFFGSVTIKNKYTVSNARPVNGEPV